MISSYLKIAYRHLIRNKLFSLINIFGLTLGFLCFTAISLYLHDELSFDLMHSDAKSIYRIIRHQQTEEGSITNTATVPGRIGPELLQQFGQVSEVMRISAYGSFTMGNDPMSRGYEEIHVADSTFFDFFDFKLLHGDPKTALTHPNGIVISQKIALRYFNSEDALGKAVWANGNNLFITGVMEDFPPDSHLQLDLIFTQQAVDNNFPFHSRVRTNDWFTNSTATYIKLNDTKNLPNFENQITQLVEQNYPPDQNF
ncbi:MAG: ABC transporter permease, partial [Cyclobacteriaceae bacterium]